MCQEGSFSELRKEVPWLWFRLSAHETQLARAEGPAPTASSGLVIALMNII